MREEWRDVIGYEGFYQVSNQGRVKRIKHGSGSRVGKIHRTYVHPKTGYVLVSLCRDCKGVSHLMHKLVAAAFIGQRPKGYDINHKDFNKENNCDWNLEYKTRLGNVRHSWINGMCAGNPAKPGEENHQAKLTWKQVKEIRRLYVRGSRENGQPALAKLFGVSQPMIGCIVRGDRWKLS